MKSVLGALAVLAVLLTGCTSQVRGSAIPPTAAPSSPTPTPTTAAPEVPVQQAVMESHRMGVHVIDPGDVLTHLGSGCFPDGPYPTPKETAAIVLGPDTEKFLVRSGYVAGWFQCFQVEEKNGRGGVVGMMEAYDEAHAGQLVSALGFSGIHPGSQAIDLPGLPDATVVRYPNFDKQPVIWAFQRTGRVISYAYTDVKSGGDAAVPAIRDTVTKLLKAQIAKTAGFTPTPVDKLGALDDDPQLLDGKLAQPEGDPDYWNGGYSAETYPAIAGDPDRELPLLKHNGFTEMYRKEGSGHGYRVGMIFALPDVKSAKRVFAGRVQQIKAPPTPKELPAPKQMKDVYCYLTNAGSTGGQACVFRAGRYFLQLAIFNGPDKGRKTTALTGMIHKQLALTPQ
ncbi:MAG TPA: hypothetical protein VHC49_04935 [Mycobacteriales bacterium]|nr:hypothetical protein [Mycobacteriales bacterium]